MISGSAWNERLRYTNRLVLTNSVRLLTGLTFLVVVTADATDSVASTHLSWAYLFLVTLALVHSTVVTRNRSVWVFGLQIALVIAIGGLAAAIFNGGLGNRPFEVGAVLVCTLLFILVREEVPSINVQSAPYLIAFATLFGIFLTHSIQFPADAALGLLPVFAGIILGLNLFVIPRHVSQNTVYWSISLVTAGVAVLALRTVIIGDYQIGPFEVQTWRNATLPIGGVPVSSAIYANPNTFGLVMFPGVVTSLVAAHRTYTLSRYPTVAVIPALCFLLTAVGLALSYSRAAILAAAIGCGLYIAITETGSKGIPFFVAGALIAVSLFLSAVFFEILPINPGNRFTIWRTGIRTLFAEGSAFGPGLVSSSDLMEPYAPAGAGGFSPHNSYLSIVLRMGFIGGLAYLVLVVGPLVHSIVRPVASMRSVGMLALASGFAVHQLFEAYTLYQFGPGSIFGALAVGYVIESLSVPVHTQSDGSVSKMPVQ